MTKHTPGPWQFRLSTDEDHALVQRGRSGGFVVRGASVEQENADARLIAAAPDLLLALINLEHGVDLPADSPSLADIRAAARAAIAKATGP